MIPVPNLKIFTGADVREQTESPEKHKSFHLKRNFHSQQVCQMKKKNLSTADDLEYSDLCLMTLGSITENDSKEETERVHGEDFNRGH